MSEAPHEVLHIDVSSAAGDGVMTVALAGELDLVSTERFSRAIADARRSTPLRVVIDLAELTFVDSSGINALLHAVRAIEAEGGTAVLASPSPATRRIFEIARLTELVEVVDAPDAALLDRAREDTPS